MDLKQTFERHEVHNAWESVYRGNPLQDRFNSLIWDRILAHIRPGPSAVFLDAGCGVGYHCLAVAGRGYRCVGVDISECVLKEAQHNASQARLADRATFACEKLERLSFATGTFDVVHCRGVLMHIPEWEKALEELCRVLKPGGKLVILESNTTSVEAYVAGALRLARKPASRLSRTPGGLEFWSEQEGRPFVTRITRVSHLTGRLREFGVTPVKRFATEFWDINRFPAGATRNLAVTFNRLCFTLRLPAFLSMGNAILGSKATADDKATA